MLRILITLRDFITNKVLKTEYGFVTPMSIFIDGIHILEVPSPIDVLEEMPDEWLDKSVKDFNWFSNMLVVRI